jgi:phenylpyruvate tautomerase PptA (4-oxalocrotonate tautomerase family)
MPLLKIQTNTPLDAGRKAALAASASRAVADMLGKPERYVMVSVEENPSMLFAGSDAPLAYLELKSIGLPVAGGEACSAALAALLAEQLDLPAERVYIEFADVPPDRWGWNGGTF